MAAEVEGLQEAEVKSLPKVLGLRGFLTEAWVNDQEVSRVGRMMSSLLFSYFFFPYSAFLPLAPGLENGLRPIEDTCRPVIGEVHQGRHEPTVPDCS